MLRAINDKLHRVACSFPDQLTFMENVLSLLLQMLSIFKQEVVSGKA